MNDTFEPVKEKDVEIIGRLWRDVHRHLIDRGERLSGSGDEKVLFIGEFWTAETVNTQIPLAVP